MGDDVELAVAPVGLDRGGLVARLGVVGEEALEELLHRGRPAFGALLCTRCLPFADVGQPILGRGSRRWIGLLTYRGGLRVRISIGRPSPLKLRFPHGSVGSSPPGGTTILCPHRKYLISRAVFSRWDTSARRWDT